MRKLRIVSVCMAAVMLIGCMSVLASCASDKEEKIMTLESYLQESESGAAELEQINESLSNENMTGKVDVKENKITMKVTLTQSIDKKYFDEMEGALNDMIEKQGSSFRDAVSRLEEESEISGIEMELVLVNADGTEICRKTL